MQADWSNLVFTYTHHLDRYGPIGQELLEEN